MLYTLLLPLLCLHYVVWIHRWVVSFQGLGSRACDREVLLPLSVRDAQSFLLWFFSFLWVASYSPLEALPPILPEPLLFRKSFPYRIYCIFLFGLLSCVSSLVIFPLNSALFLPYAVMSIDNHKENLGHDIPLKQIPYVKKDSRFTINPEFQNQPKIVHNQC